MGLKITYGLFIFKCDSCSFRISDAEFVSNKNYDVMATANGIETTQGYNSVVDDVDDNNGKSNGNNCNESNSNESNSDVCHTSSLVATKIATKYQN